MANYFVNSGSATPAAPYTTRATAALTISTVMADASAGGFASVGEAANHHNVFIRGRVDGSGVPIQYTEAVVVPRGNVDFFYFDVVHNGNAGTCLQCHVGTAVHVHGPVQFRNCGTALSCSAGNDNFQARNFHVFGHGAHAIVAQSAPAGTVFENFCIQGGLLGCFIDGVGAVVRNFAVEGNTGSGLPPMRIQGASSIVADGYVANTGTQPGFHITGASTKGRRLTSWNNVGAGTLPTDNVDYVTATNPTPVNTARRNLIPTHADFQPGGASGGRVGATFAAPGGARDSYRGPDDESIGKVTDGSTRYHITNWGDFQANHTNDALDTIYNTLTEDWEFVAVPATTQDTITTTNGQERDLAVNNDILWISKCSSQNRSAGAGLNDIVDRDADVQQRGRYIAGLVTSLGAPNTSFEYGRLLGATGRYISVEHTLDQNGA